MCSFSDLYAFVYHFRLPLDFLPLCRKCCSLDLVRSCALLILLCVFLNVLYKLSWRNQETAHMAGNDQSLKNKSRWSRRHRAPGKATLRNCVGRFRGQTVTKGPSTTTTWRGVDE